MKQTSGYWGLVAKSYDDLGFHRRFKAIFCTRDGCPEKTPPFLANLADQLRINFASTSLQALKRDLGALECRRLLRLLGLLSCLPAGV